MKGGLLTRPLLLYTSPRHVSPAIFATLQGFRAFENLSTPKKEARAVNGTFTARLGRRGNSGFSRTDPPVVVTPANRGVVSGPWIRPPPRNGCRLCSRLAAA